MTTNTPPTLSPADRERAIAEARDWFDTLEDFGTKYIDFKVSELVLLVSALLGEHAYFLRYRSILNRICRVTGAVPISPDEIDADHIAASVEALARYKDDLEERHAAITPGYLAAHVASLEHHEEHHQREREMEAATDRLRAEVAELAAQRDRLVERMIVAAKNGRFIVFQDWEQEIGDWYDTHDQAREAILASIRGGEVNG